MSIVSYESHNITVIYNVKCAQTTLYNIFGRPWNPTAPSYFSSWFSAGDNAKLDLFLKKYPKNYNIAFVRNPWARNVSMWSYSKQHSKKKDFPTFTQYCDFMYEDRNNKKPRFSQVIPLSFFIGDNFDKLDFIGHQETLAEDVKFIADKYGIPFKGLPRHNRSRHGPWKELYNEKSKQIVYDVYKKDIEMFGFEF